MAYSPNNSSSSLTNSQQSSETPVLTCALANVKSNKTEPCDAESLTIEGDKRSVTTSLPRHRRTSNKPANGLASEKVELAKNYDLVLEVVAEVPLAGKANKDTKGTKLTINGTFVGKCPLKAHGELNFQPEVKSKLDKEKPVKLVGTSIPPMDVWGVGQESDGKIVKNFSYCWPSLNPEIKNCVITSSSCGVRTSGATKNGFIALVRIYRKDKWELNFVIPPFKKFSASRKPTKDEGVKTETQTQTNGETTSSSEKTRKDGLLIEHKATYQNKSGQTYEYEKNLDEAYTNKLIKTEYVADGLVSKTTKGNEGSEQTTFQVRPTLSLKKNGIESDFTKVINDVLAMANAVRNALDAIRDAVPKAGFSVSLDVSAFEGSIVGSWGYRVDPRYDSAEYKWVSFFADLAVNLCILKIDFSVMFGIDIRNPRTFFWNEGEKYQFTAMLKLELKLEANVSHKFTITGASDPERPESIGFEVPGEGTFYGEATANVWGYSISAKTGIEVNAKVSGSVKVGINTPLKVPWRLSREDWVVYFDLIGPKGSSEPRWEKIIWKEDDKWRSGELFGA